jgi:transposase
LQERGYYLEKPPNFKYKVKCPELAAYPVLISDMPSCYLARILSTHKDFFKQKSAIGMLIKDKGHKCVFIPKFHCELNAIKIYWGYLKARYRQVKKTSFEHAKREVLIALDICSINIMRRFYNRSLRFINVAILPLDYLT